MLCCWCIGSKRAPQFARWASGTDNRLCMIVARLALNFIDIYIRSLWFYVIL